MRVTEHGNYELVRGTINRAKQRLEGLQNQASTLKKLNAPSDDPVSASKVLETRTDKVNNDQFSLNAKLAETLLNNTDHVLSELSEVVSRAKEIAIGQSSGASSNDDTRVGIAEEVDQLYKHAVAVANTRIGDRYLFGGYRTSKPPVDPEGAYQGDTGQIMVEIAKGVFLSTNLTGIEAFNTNPQGSADARSEAYLQGAQGQNRGPASIESDEDENKAKVENVNVFDEIQKLRIGLLSGNTEGIQSTLERLDGLHSRLVGMRAKVGSRLNGLQGTQQTIERQNITNSQLSSALEDADMVQVVGDMAKEESVYKSALSTSQKLIQPTLLDFLK